MSLKPNWKGSLYYLISFLCAGAYNPFIFVYLSELGLTGQQVGLLASLAPVMTMLLATPLSSLADRNQWRVRLLQASMIGSALIVFLLQFPTVFNEIAVLMLFSAILSSPKMSIADSLIARMAQRNKLNYGGMRLWGSLGFALSALAFGAIWQVFGFKPMFVVGSLLYLPLIFISGKLEEGPVTVKNERKPVSHLFQDRGIVLLLVATFLSGVANSLSMTFGGIYARFLGGGDLLIGMMIAFGAFAELPMMFFSDRISKRLHNANTVIIAYGLMTLAYVGYILVPTAEALPYFSILKGLGYGLWFTGNVRLVTERTPPEWASTAQSLLGVATFGLAPLVAGPLGGLIHDTISPAAVFGLAIVSLVLAALVLWIAARAKLL